MPTINTLAQGQLDLNIDHQSKKQHNQGSLNIRDLSELVHLDNLLQ